ncbi:hypothetical protein Halxa_3362 [Halopiger xanaduensis SH-6]|uniref:Uncharacterized protein n=1 Tax=Halopiger xanaduensis (strain DSM 18323 / JCM 14033 / SH-6) TaxID=797210 RepID=F8D874_HALXS|nr:hypothetical protein Halxa_3362 [Halopiger xanaduensis SH-6]
MGWEGGWVGGWVGVEQQQRQRQRVLICVGASRIASAGVAGVCVEGSERMEVAEAVERERVDG